MYIVTMYDNCEMNHEPRVFTDELEAYKDWATAIVGVAYEYQIIDKDLCFSILDRIKDWTNANRIVILLENLLENREDIYIIKNGYAICYGEYEIIIQIFEKGEIK